MIDFFALIAVKNRRQYSNEVNEEITFMYLLIDDDKLEKVKMTVKAKNSCY